MTTGMAFQFGEASVVRQLLTALAAREWTLASLLLTTLAVLAVTSLGATPTWVTLPPLAMLAANLSAALVVTPKLRTDLPLLLFHLCLLLLIVLFGFVRLTYLDAGATLVRGEAFDGSLVMDERGPWHRGPFEQIRFVNEGFGIVYPNGGEYRATFNRVRWLDEQGQWQEGQIGGDRPLVFGDYRIYTTGNRGFAPHFLWEAAGRPPVAGSVQLEGLDAADAMPANRVALPGGREGWLMLDYTHQPNENRRTIDNLGAANLEHRLIVRTGERRDVIRPGDHLDLPGGRLTYVRLDSWMGYSIVYDPTRSWLLGTLMLAIASLCWFYLRRLSARGWDEPA